MAAKFLIFLLVTFQLLRFGHSQACTDNNALCDNWSKAGFCELNDPYINSNCGAACGICNGGRQNMLNLIAKKYDPRRLNAELQPLGKFLGIWKSDHGGKADFPTIPVFTYGEEIEFSIGDDNPQFPAVINYTAYAYGLNTNDDLHSEHGYFTARGPTQISLTTVMNNGFTTVEEGSFDSGGTQLTLNLRDIGRISFGRDLQVTKSRRTYTFLSDRNLDERFEMETLTHTLQDHTHITYRKVFPPEKIAG